MNYPMFGLIIVTIACLFASNYLNTEVSAETYKEVAIIKQTNDSPKVQRKITTMLEDNKVDNAEFIDLKEMVDSERQAAEKEQLKMAILASSTR